MLQRDFSAACSVSPGHNKNANSKALPGAYPSAPIHTCGATKPNRPGDPAFPVADASAARSVLKFTPRHSDLTTIIRTAWAWHRKAHPQKADELACPTRAAAAALTAA